MALLLGGLLHGLELVECETATINAFSYCIIGDGRGTRGKVRGLKLVYNLPEPVREAGLSSVTLDLPFDSIMSLSRDNTLSQMIEEMVHTHFHLKLSVSYSCTMTIMNVLLSRYMQSLTLVGVSTPVLQIHCDAIIKVCMYYVYLWQKSQFTPHPHPTVFFCRSCDFHIVSHPTNFAILITQKVCINITNISMSTTL